MRIVSVYRAMGACWVVATVIQSRHVQAQAPGWLFGYTASDQSAQASEWYYTVDFEASKHATIGLLLNFDVGFWRWEPRANYVVKGREDALNLYYYTNYSTATAEVYDRLEYLSLQSDFHVKVPVGNASFYALWAPRLDILLDQETGVGWDENYEGQRPDLILSRYAPTVFGMALGLGQDIKVGRHTMFLEVRYDWDLEPAWTFGVAPPYLANWDMPAGPVHNRTLLLQLGFRLWTSAPQPPDVTGWPLVNPPAPSDR